MSVQSAFCLQNRRLKRPDDVNRPRVKNKQFEGPISGAAITEGDDTRNNLQQLKIKGTQGKIPVPTFLLDQASYLHEVTVPV